MPSESEALSPFLRLTFPIINNETLGHLLGSCSVSGSTICALAASSYIIMTLFNRKLGEHVACARSYARYWTQYEGKWLRFLQSGSEQSRVRVLKLRCISTENHWGANSGPHFQIGITIFLSHLTPSSHFVKSWSGAMGEVYYYAHVTCEETEIQRS